MAAGLGTQGTGGRRRLWRLLEGATATNNAPSGSSAGRSVTDLDTDLGAKYEAPSVTIAVNGAGTGAQSVTIRIWGFLSTSGASGVWFPLTYLNNGNAITGATTYQHAEKVDDLFDFDRIYAEVTAISGTSNTVNVDVRVPVLPPS